MIKTNPLKILLVLVLMTGIPSCDKDCDCCDIDGPVYYSARIIDFYIDRIDKQVAPTQWERYTTGDTVNANGDIVIYLDSFNEQIAFHRKRSTNYSFINSAYACSPAYLPVTEQEFVNLTITSNQDYDSAHPAGTDLIDLFVTRGEPSAENNVKMPLSQHLATNSNYFILYAPWIFLNGSPDEISKHIFSFELELSDTTFTFQTRELILK